ncbi:MAG TPA: rhomboid family intramembrane serine protease [Candidatus Angelobacter sp.]|nr:rhomboid family intramembrane serine protease [Candidatus Angelobacter sp.]
MRDTSFQFSLPRFRGAVRHLVILTGGLWAAIVLLWAFSNANAQLILTAGSLTPKLVRVGWVWQFVTYAFIHLDPRHLLACLVGLYFIGSSVEERIGQRAFFELYLGSAVVAGLAGFLVSSTGLIGQGTAMGAGAAVNAVLMVFYFLNRGAHILLFPFPFRIPVGWVVAGVAAIETSYFLLEHFSLFFLVQLLGLGSGYVWYRFVWRQGGVTGMFQQPFFSLRNSYYRWKRRRAAKKFQVYMRKHGQDPKEYFDEYGNFRPPDDKKDRGRGGWVN